MSKIACFPIPRRVQQFKNRLGRVKSILEFVDTNELLSALPECPLSRKDHLDAVALLSHVASEVHDLWAMLDRLDLDQIREEMAAETAGLLPVPASVVG